MAQVARTAPSPPASAVSGGRLAPSARSIANVDGAPIEELSPKIGAHLDDGAQLFQEFGHGGRGGAGKGRHVPQNGSGSFDATSQAFAAFIEFEAGPENGGDNRINGGGSRFAGLLAKAINTYETNARVISGSLTPKGSALSLSL